MSDFDLTKIRKLDFTLLAVLHTLLRVRRTTEAARVLGLSPSAISHALARLRLLFGEPLFLRRPHGLEPTRHALALAPAIEALLAGAQAAMGSGDDFDPARTARDFRLAAPDHVGTLLAPPLLAAFERQAPQARFALRALLGADALEALRRNEIDLALGQFPPAAEGLKIEPLYQDRYVLVARRGHPDLRRRVSRAAFEALPHVMISVGGNFRAITDEHFRAQNLKRRVVATVPRFETAFAVVRDTRAVAIAPERLARRHALMFRLAIHALPVAPAPIRIMLVRRTRPDRGVEWLAERVRLCFAPSQK
jgi:DNA-binding transcriptional LysR family regulator